MTVHRRTEITVETDRVLIIRQRRSVRAWCQECGCEVDMVSLGEALALAKVPGLEFREFAEARRWHLSESQDGTCLVCLGSLWNQP
ncbi:MAG: hypothetical protein WBQ89_15375 [Candidatus Acidiferrum sp.]